MVLVPRHPTKEMLEAAWADGLAEDVAGVCGSMIDTGLSQRSGNSDMGSLVSFRFFNSRKQFIIVQDLAMISEVISPGMCLSSP